MKKISFVLVLAGSFAFFSCKDSKTVETEPEVVSVETQDNQEVYAIAPGNVAFNDQEVADVFAQYLRVQTALINTDGSEAQQESAKLNEMISNGNLQANDEVKLASSTMAGTSDVEVQREGFETISDWIVEAIDGKIESGTLYKQYCPMAFNDKGAYWISPDKKILNPYFGDKMLRCGRVEMEIK